MSTSSIYYTATDVPMRNESWHAEQAFKSYKLGGELWFSCVLYIVTACVGFVGLFAIDSSDCPNIVLEIFAKIYFASMCMLGIGYLAFAAKRLMYRKYYSKPSRGKGELYRIDIIEPNDDDWGIQFTSPNGVFTYLNLGCDLECSMYAIELLQFDADFRSEINSYLADPVNKKVSTEEMINSKYEDLCDDRPSEDEDEDDGWYVDDKFV
ncbi:MAG: hypothetical protein ACFNUB_01445 [Candidatus Saccharibacteria bacterium]